MAMKLSRIHIFWTFLLVLCRCKSVFSPLTDTDNNHSDLCHVSESMELPTQALCYHRNSAGEMQLDPDDEECGEDLDFSESCQCLLYPTNTLNCTILDSFPAGSQVSGSISTCDGAKTISYRNFTLKEDKTLETGVTVMSASLSHTVEDNMSSIMLRINVSLPDLWTIYYVIFDIYSIEVLSPPAFNVSMPNGSLVVRWDLPVTRTRVQPVYCFDYQLDINGQLINMSGDGQQLYKESNADPTLPYKVKLRTQKSKNCLGPQHWSNWSHTFTVDPTRPDELDNYWLLMSIVLVLPMILLSVLLLLKHHRVGNIIFPAVPQPPEKYKAFLKNPNAFNLLPPPVQSNHSMEHISEVKE